MNEVKVGGIYKASHTKLNKKTNDLQIIVKAEGLAFLDDISIFTDKSCGIEVGDSFRILEITAHTRTTRKSPKGYYSYSSINAVVEKTDEEGTTIEVPQEEKW